VRASSCFDFFRVGQAVGDLLAALGQHLENGLVGEFEPAPAQTMTKLMTWAMKWGKSHPNVLAMFSAVA
jgi:hypothetical protein